MGGLHGKEIAYCQNNFKYTSGFLFVFLNSCYPGCSCPLDRITVFANRSTEDLMADRDFRVVVTPGFLLELPARSLSFLRNGACCKLSLPYGTEV